ncbi:MAG: response regulator [Patescibacteria group bacterium]
MTNTKKKLLIIEDDEAILFSLKKKLELIPEIQIFSALNGEEGLKIAIDETPDLILLDIVLPKMNGLEMLKKFRQKNPSKDVKVIILSNLSNTNVEAEAVELGVKMYIIKADWKLEDVITKVKESLEI